MQELAEKEAFAWEGYAGAVGDDREAAAKALRKAEGLLVSLRCYFYLFFQRVFRCTIIDDRVVINSGSSSITSKGLEIPGSGTFHGLAGARFMEV